MEHKRTAWYDKDLLPKDMVDGANGKKENFRKLEESNHFTVLESMINMTDCRSIADIGCGAGESGRVFGKKIRYTGFDLPHIVEKVAKEINPSLDFVHLDAYESDFLFLRDYDLTLCNGFISELTDPIYVLGKILKESRDFVLIHRQFIDAKTGLEDYVTYGNLTTPRALLGRKEFTNIVKEYGFQTIDEHDSPDWGHSFLLKRN